MNRFNRLPTKAAIVAVRAYQGLVRPFLIGSCKFHPSCSEYAIEAINTHGLLRGFVLTVRRLARCRPFVMGGFDPVPDTQAHEPGS